MWELESEAKTKAKVISVDLRLNRSIARDLTGSLGYSHYREWSESAGDSTENRITASLHMLF